VNSWHLFGDLGSKWKNNWEKLIHQQRIQILDENRKPLDTKLGKKSDNTNPMLKWYEENTSRYIEYEAAVRKFMLEAD